MSPGFERSSRRGRWVALPGLDPVYYMGYEARLATVHRQADEASDGIRRPLRFSRCNACGGESDRIAGGADRGRSPVVRPGPTGAGVALSNSLPGRMLAMELEEGPEEQPTADCRGSHDAFPGRPDRGRYDGSLQAARALAAFQMTGLGESREVHIVSVDASAGTAAQHAERAKTFLEHHRIEVFSHVLETSSPPATVILEQIGRLGAGLLVMGAYGQPLLREFFVGSVTRTLLRESPVPLLLFH